MKTKTQTQQSNVKKAALSIAVIASVVGGLILLEDYKSEQSALSFSEQVMRYQMAAEEFESESLMADITIESKDQQIFNESWLTTDVTELASIAEANLMASNRDIIAIEKQPALVSLQLQEKQGINPAQDSVKIAPVSALVLFELSAAEIAPEYQLTLLALAAEIKAQSSDKQWQVVGYTDKSGNAQYNLALANRRSQQVADYLVQQGVNKQQLNILTLGEYEAAKRENSTYNQQLRKVEVQQYNPQVTALAKQVQQFYRKQAMVEKHLAQTPPQQQEARGSMSTDKVDKIPANAIVTMDVERSLKDTNMMALSHPTASL